MPPTTAIQPMLITPSAKSHHQRPAAGYAPCSVLDSKAQRTKVPVADAVQDEVFPVITRTFGTLLAGVIA